MNRSEVVALNKKNVQPGHSLRGYGISYFAQRDFKKGEVVMYGYGKIVDHQTSHISVQIGPRKHYLPSKWTGRFWNHSCKANTYVQTRSDGFPNLHAAQAIKKGEEITYSYWMTEFAWTKGTDELHLD